MLSRLPQPTSPDLLVGAATGDDAAIWQLDESMALVSTVDVITPVVDDARTWGRVAAANAVSDVYAMGGRPLFALNIVGWNLEALGADLLGDVLLGGSDIAAKGGFDVAGGHTIDDPEPKYGMAVTGVVDPAKMMTNAGLRVGQILILTKALGVGVITTAIKNGIASTESVDAALRSMQQLNGTAAQIAVDAGATGCTDVTGFGLIGHLGRMTVESKVNVTIGFDSIPFLPGAIELANAGQVPGGTARNLLGNEHLLAAGGRSELEQLLFADAQTSGGLVFGVDADRADSTLEALRSSGHTASAIGEVKASRADLANGWAPDATAEPTISLH